jgi:2-dehydropantoate 2-reductase
MKILVVGAGGIGGIVAGSLAEVGADVTAITTNPAILEAVRAHGFRLREDGDDRAVPGRIEAAPPPGERFDAIVLATQPPSVEEAARTALPSLADDGVMVCLQNGLCEARIAAVERAGAGTATKETGAPGASSVIGEHRVLGAIVAWGASMPEPGLYERTAAGGFTIGRMAGEPDDTCRALGELFEAIGPVTYTSNLMGARWSKLALNCAISSMGTIGGEHLGPLSRVRRYRRLCLEVMSEVVEVARKEQIRLEKVAGTLDLEWIALTDGDRAAWLGSPSLTAKHALLLAVGLRYRRMRSSMLAAIERGRTPAIDFLNGEVVSRARLHGIEVPFNQRIVDTVWAISRGEAASSRALLDQVFAGTRGADTE